MNDYASAALLRARIARPPSGPKAWQHNPAEYALLELKAATTAKLALQEHGRNAIAHAESMMFEANRVRDDEATILWQMVVRLLRERSGSDRGGTRHG